MPSHHLSVTNSYSSLKTQSNFMYQLLTLLAHPCFPSKTKTKKHPSLSPSVCALLLGRQLQLLAQRRYTVAMLPELAS